jgi:hypothetical protein
MDEYRAMVENKQTSGVLMSVLATSRRPRGFDSLSAAVGEMSSAVSSKNYEDKQNYNMKTL